MRATSKGEIKRTQYSYHVTIPFRTRNTVENRSNRWFTRENNPEEQMRFAIVEDAVRFGTFPYRTVPYGTVPYGKD